MTTVYIKTAKIVVSWVAKRPGPEAGNIRCANTVIKGEEYRVLLAQHCPLEGKEKYHLTPWCKDELHSTWPNLQVRSNAFSIPLA
jgi:hypothetical protein